MTNSATMASLQRLRKAATLAAKHARLARAGAAREGSFGDLRSRAGRQMQLELDARDLVAPPEVADVTGHPALGALLVAGPDRVQQPAVSRTDARTGLRHLVDHDAERRLEQPQQRLLSQAQHRVVGRLPEAAEHLCAQLHRLLGVRLPGGEGFDGGRDALEVARAPLARCRAGRSEERRVGKECRWRGAAYD